MKAILEVVKISVIFAFNRFSLQMASLIVMIMVGQFYPSIIPILNTSLVYAGVLYVLITVAIISTQGRLAGLHGVDDETGKNHVVGGGVAFIAVISLSITGAVLVYFMFKENIEFREGFFITTLCLTAFPLGINTLFSTYLESIGSEKVVLKVRLLQVIIQLLLIAVVLLVSNFLREECILLLPVAYLLADTLTLLVFVRVINRYADICDWCSFSPSRLVAFIKEYFGSGIGGVIQKLSFMVLVGYVSNLPINDIQAFFIVVSVFGVASILLMGVSALLSIEVGKLSSSHFGVVGLVRVVGVYVVVSSIVLLFQSGAPGLVSSIFIAEKNVIERVASINEVVLLYFLMNIVLIFSMAISRGVGNNNIAQMILAPAMIFVSVFIYYDGSLGLDGAIRCYSAVGLISGGIILIHSMFIQRSMINRRFGRDIAKKMQR